MNMKNIEQPAQMMLVRELKMPSMRMLFTIWNWEPVDLSGFGAGELSKGCSVFDSGWDI